MCGLFGFDRTTEVTKRMTPVLALKMSERGQDSWGVTDGETIFKMVGSITDTFCDVEFDGPTYHTRAASIGAVTERNAHPFVVESPTKVIVGVHNGHIGNYFALKDKYKRTSCEVDSEQIFHHLAFGEDLGEIGGWGVVVWYEYPPGQPDQRVRYFSMFNSAALEIAKLKSGELVFASTKNAIETAACLSSAPIDIFYNLKPKVKYWFQDGHLVTDQTVLDWGKNPLANPIMTHSGRITRVGYGANFVHTGNFSSSKRTTNDCAIGICAKQVGAKELICDYHLRELRLSVVGS